MRGKRPSFMSPQGSLFCVEALSLLPQAPPWKNRLQRYGSSRCPRQLVAASEHSGAAFRALQNRLEQRLRTVPLFSRHECLTSMIPWGSSCCWIQRAVHGHFVPSFPGSQSTSMASNGSGRPAKPAHQGNDRVQYGLGARLGAQAGMELTRRVHAFFVSRRSQMQPPYRTAQHRGAIATFPRDDAGILPSRHSGPEIFRAGGVGKGPGSDGHPGNSFLGNAGTPARRRRGRDASPLPSSLGVLYVPIPPASAVLLLRSPPWKYSKDSGRPAAPRAKRWDRAEA